MEFSTIIQRNDVYFLISTVNLDTGDYPYETKITAVDGSGQSSKQPLYHCVYAKREFAQQGHENLVKVWGF